MSWPLSLLAGFQVTIIGRFWVTAEAWIQGLKADAEQLADRLQRPRLVHRIFQELGHVPLLKPRILAFGDLPNCRI
jgi:hypothetical protein